MRLTRNDGGGEAPGPAPALEDAIALAAAAHRGQGYPTSSLRREPFILHPLRVMLRVGSDAERMVAVLHDLVEDTGHTLGDLRRLGYPGGVVEAVDRLTRRGGEPYDGYIRRVEGHPVARRVKLADLADNIANNRGVDPIEEERARLERHERARARLLAAEDEASRHA